MDRCTVKPASREKFASDVRLSARQLRILSFIVCFREQTGYPPSIRQIGQAVGIHSLRGVTIHLDVLQRRGCLERIQGVARGLRVTPLGFAVLAERTGLSSQYMPWAWAIAGGYDRAVSGPDDLNGVAPAASATPARGKACVR